MPTKPPLRVTLYSPGRPAPACVDHAQVPAVVSSAGPVGAAAGVYRDQITVHRGLPLRVGYRLSLIIDTL